MSIKWARSSILQSVITLTIPTADVHTLINGVWTSIECMNTVLVMSLTGGMGSHNNLLQETGIDD